MIQAAAFGCDFVLVRRFESTVPRCTWTAQRAQSHPHDYHDRHDEFDLACAIAIVANEPLEWNRPFSFPNTFKAYVDASRRIGLHDGLVASIRFKRVTYVWEFCQARPTGAMMDEIVKAGLVGAAHLTSARIEAGLERKPPATELSSCEVLILQLRATGKSYAEIGRMIGLSVKTIEFHAMNVIRKLQVDNLQAAILLSAKIGYIEI